MLVSETITASLLRPLPGRVPRDAQFWRDGLARLLHRKVLGQDTIFYQANHTVLGFLVKLLWHVLDFPIYSDGTKPGTLQSLLSIFTLLPPEVFEVEIFNYGSLT